MIENQLPLRTNWAESLLVGDVASTRFAEVKSLTQAIARGDEDAFNVFYAEYSPRVYRLLLVVTRGDEALSRELHQAVMIRAAQKMKVLETEKQLWAWLAEVARNQWRDVCRKRAREQRFASEAVPIDMVRFRDEADLSAERIGILEGALKLLSAADRELVESFYIHDLPQAELAHRSGRTVKAVQCALARIRKRLREVIKGQEK
jgi:RNA polymerase sigma factor (sigma-70 family)